MGNSKNNFPFANGIKKLKDEFKKMVDEMPDEEFIDMVAFLMHSDDAFEDDEWAFDEEYDYDELWSEDEGWEDEAEKFYNQGKNKKSNNVSFIDDDNLPL